jgi:olefin beta-lactone synthetase
MSELVIGWRHFLMAVPPESSGEISSVNIAHYLPKLAKQRGDDIAIIDSKNEKFPAENSSARISFKGLETETNRIANALLDAGIKRGMRTMLMVRPSIDFITISFALFKIGAIPLLIDPGMGRKNFLHAVSDVKPQAFVGIEMAQIFRLVFRRAFKSVEHVVTVGRRWFWGGASLAALKAKSSDQFEMVQTRSDETAAILFTTGSTGPAKGVVYTHGIFDAQTQIIRREWGVKAGETDLPIFPLFALFSTALGAKVVIPDMDPTRPAYVDAEKMVQAIENYEVSFSFGSPAFWTRVAAYCLAQDKRLPNLQRVLMAGAPISVHLVRDMAKIMPSTGDVGIPYGATESLPVSWISGAEVRASTGEATLAGEGYCVGRPLDVNTVKIIGINDDVIESWDQVEERATGEVGEIVVKGPIVTHSYFGRDRATQLAKIAHGQNIWHRMGDLGYFDEQGRLWFCGRKAHRVETGTERLFSVRCEAIFNVHAQVKRSALVGISSKDIQIPVIIIERVPGRYSKQDEEILKEELLALGNRSELTKNIHTILFHPSFPVDIRHNAKIFREKLAIWASQEVQRT